MPSLGRLKNYEDNKERYAQLRSQGLCVVCAVNTATTNSGTGGNGGKSLKYCESCRCNALESKKENRAQMKLKVLSHYGKDGHLLCCWPDCIVIDPDMLTIDHMDNSGAEERKKDKTHAGMTFYAILKRKGYPEGFQTLCHNHQWKKELMRRRGE